MATNPMSLPPDQELLAHRPMSAPSNVPTCMTSGPISIPYDPKLMARRISSPSNVAEMTPPQIYLHYSPEIRTPRLISVPSNAVYMTTRLISVPSNATYMTPGPISLPYDPVAMAPYQISVPSNAQHIPRVVQADFRCDMNSSHPMMLPGQSPNLQPPITLQNTPICEIDRNYCAQSSNSTTVIRQSAVSAINEMEFPVLNSNDRKVHDTTITSVSLKNKISSPAPPDLLQTMFESSSYKSNIKQSSIKDDKITPTKTIKTARMTKSFESKKSGNGMSPKLVELDVHLKALQLETNKIKHAADTIRRIGNQVKARELYYQYNEKCKVLETVHEERTNVAFKESNPESYLLQGCIDLRGIYTRDIPDILTDILLCYNIHLSQVLFNTNNKGYNDNNNDEIEEEDDDDDDGVTTISNTSRKVTVGAPYKSNYLPEKLVTKMKLKYMTYIDILTGSGYHNNTNNNNSNYHKSSNGIQCSPLFQAVEQYMIRYQFTYIILKNSNDKYAGIRVTIG